MNKAINVATSFMKKYNIPSATLYHYCPLSTLLSIIESMELWLGRTAYMNDTQEVYYFINNLNNCLQKTLPKNKLQRCNTIFKEVDRQILEESRYAFCLSELYDDAAQWERYSDNACGVSLGFNPTVLIALIHNIPLTFTQVVYGYDPMNHDVYKVLKEYIENNPFIDDFRKVDGIISNMLACAIKYKHASFSSEQEWRVGTLLSDNNSSQFCPDFRQDFKLMSNGSIRSVVVLDLKSRCSQFEIAFDDLFDNIIIGPRSKQSVGEFQGYLKKLGHDKLAEKVYKSTCPLR